MNELKNMKPLLDFSGKEPWFEPVRFWKYWAAFYPVSWQGWVVTLGILLFLYVAFLIICARTAGGWLIVGRFLPFLLVGFASYDTVSLSRGKHPHWWKKRGRKKNMNEK